MTKSLLYQTHPLLRSEYDDVVNFETIATYSSKILQWKCLNNSNHPPYKMRVADKTKCGCPYCSGKRTIKEESFAYNYPEILSQWSHNNIDPYSISIMSGKKFYWKCLKNKNHPDHFVSVSCKTQYNTKCPYCSNNKIIKENSFGYINKALLKEWDLNKNKISPYSIGPKSSKKVWWVCEHSKNHSFIASVANRVRNHTKCPYCSGKFLDVNKSLQITEPILMKEWDYNKNIKNPSEVSRGSSTKFWWICSMNETHQWEAVVNDRVSKNSGCPYCSGTKVLPENSFGTLFPELAKEWNEKKLSPLKFTRSSGKIITWKCKNDSSHVWKATISNRTTNNSGCPDCSTRRNEKLTFEYIKQLFHNSEIISQYPISINNRILKIDIKFSINDKIIFIEYNGDQHYRPVDFGFNDAELADANFEKQKIRDDLVKQYCFENEILLIEIDGRKYKNDKIKMYLEDLFKNVLTR